MVELKLRQNVVLERPGWELWATFQFKQSKHASNSDSNIQNEAPVALLNTCILTKKSIQRNNLLIMQFDRLSLLSQTVYLKGLTPPFRISLNSSHSFMNASFVILYLELLFQYTRVHTWWVATVLLLAASKKARGWIDTENAVPVLLLI